MSFSSNLRPPFARTTQPRLQRPGFWRATCVALLLTAAAAAADEAAQCHGVADREARLACYDQVTARTTPAPDAAPAANPPAPTAATRDNADHAPPAGLAHAAQEREAAAQEREAAAQEREAAAQEREAAAAGSSRGRREVLQEDQPLTGAVIIQALTTSIGRYQFMLDNGELWEQVETRRVDLREGDRVDVRPGMLNAWQMRASDGKGRSIRVRRAN